MPHCLASAGDSHAKFILALVAAVAFSMSATPVAAQDLNKGLKAYEASNYATALRAWRPLAEQGLAAAQFRLGVMYDKA